MIFVYNFVSFRKSQILLTQTDRVSQKIIFRFFKGTPVGKDRLDVWMQKLNMFFYPLVCQKDILFIIEVSNPSFYLIFLSMNEIHWY